VLALAFPGTAQSVSGSDQLLAKDKLAAKGCGRATLTGPQMLTLMDDGSWTAMSDGGDTLGGTYAPVGNKD
jgi:hypothetical protein